MAAPRSNLLFADSFRHDRLCQHIDEKKFWNRRRLALRDKHTTVIQLLHFEARSGFLLPSMWQLHTICDSGKLGPQAALDAVEMLLYKVLIVGGVLRKNTPGFKPLQYASSFVLFELPQLAGRFEKLLCSKVRFTEPVVITACEVVELQQPSLCPSISLKGCSSPESCALEIYVRSGGDARFQRLGPAFLHSPAATSLLDVQAAVTEHVVLRGSYTSLTLVIYGNLASELCLDRDLDSDVSSGKASSQGEHLQEALNPSSATVSAQRCLHLVAAPSAGQGQLLHRLVQCVGGEDTTQHLVSIFLTAAAAWHLSQQCPAKGAEWYTVKKPDLLDGLGKHFVSDPSQELLELQEWVQQREEESLQATEKPESRKVLLQLTLQWLKSGLEFSSVPHSSLSSVDSLIGGLAAAQLLCSKGPDEVPQFLAAGGLELLLQVVEEVSGATALLLFALAAVECACRHGCACEAFLSLGKGPLLTLLQQKHRPPVQKLLQQLLQRLQTYQLAVAFEPMVEKVTNAGENAAEVDAAVNAATKVLNELLGILTARGFEDKSFAAQKVEQSGIPLVISIMDGGSFEERSTVEPVDIDPLLLSLLQEKRFMPSVAALLSVSNIWTAKGGPEIGRVHFISAVQKLFLQLLGCRSGLLFLNADTKAAEVMVTELRKMQEGDVEVLPLRHAVALTSLGFLCPTGDLARMLQISSFVMNGMDRLAAADSGSEDAFWALWDLAGSARSEAGRQAVLSVAWFPEVLNLLVESLHPAPQSTQGIGGGAAGHFAAEILQKVLCDAALTNQILLTPHAPALQIALQAASGTGGGNYSRILEWAEAATVYQMKGAAGLLKYVGALIGPQNNTAGLHMDSSMDDDANNLRDRAPGSDLQMTKGMIAPLIQDSAVHALTVSLRLLASAAWNSRVAAMLYGEGATGVVCAVLEHCVVALQISSNDYDDEETEEEEGRVEEQQKERVLLALLLPTLLLLLSLLKRLQGGVTQNRNTRLLDLLLSLHHGVSAKAGAYETVPLCSWTGGVLEVGAVRQVLASLLAFWPICGWTPELLPRLLGPNLTSIPVDPGEACSVVCLLEEFLLPESPRLHLDKAAMADVRRSMTVGSLLGVDLLYAVRWHTLPSSSEKMLHELYHHLEQIGQLIIRLAPSTCDVVQERLTSLVTRLACQSAEHAAILVRPVLLYLQQQTAAASTSLLSHIDVLQVERILQWLAQLAVHPSSKAILLQEGAVQVLVQALTLPTAGNPKVSSSRFGWWFWSCKAVAHICDPAISFKPDTSMDRHMAEDCPDFDDCCSIATSLLPLFQVLPLGKHTEVLAFAWEKLASHDIGRAAMASVAMCPPGSIQPLTGQEREDSDPAWASERDKLPLLNLWQKVAAALGSFGNLNLGLVGLIRRLAVAATVFANSGDSACGVGALKAMFGLGLMPEPMETRAVEENLQPLVQVAHFLQHNIVQPGGAEVVASVPELSLQEARTAVTAMLNTLKTPAKNFNLNEEIESVMGLLPTPRPISERRAEAQVTQVSSSLRMMSTDTSAEDFELMDLDIADTSVSDVRGTIPWDCPRLSQERPLMAMSSSKRRVISTIEVASKRHRGEGGVSALVGRTTSVATSNRRDMFRQRKPNTSRPPSMHVDDYVAREKTTDGAPGANPATPAAPLQRSNSSGGRAPSIHVDEFMARQRESRQPSPPSLVHTTLVNGGTRSRGNSPEVEEDGLIPGILESNSHVTRATEYSSVSMIVSQVTPLLSNSDLVPPMLGVTDSTATPGPSTRPAPHIQLVKPPTLQRNTSSLTSATSELTNFAHQLNRTEDMKQEQSAVMASPRQDLGGQSLASPVLKPKLENSTGTNNGVEGPGLQLSRAYDPKESSTVAVVKKETKQPLVRSSSVRSLTPEGAAALGPNITNTAPQMAASPQNPHIEIKSKLVLPPPPALPTSWLDPPLRLLDSLVLPPPLPLLVPHMGVGTYNYGPASRPPADLRVGGAVLQPPAGLWREPPPFTSLPHPVPPAHAPVQHVPPLVSQPYGVSRQSESSQVYPMNPSASTSLGDRRFGNFGGPMPGQSSGLPAYQPPVPVGRPLMPSIASESQPSSHHPLQVHPEAEINTQQEPGAVLQQILASPDAIQSLLKDPKKLQQLLEQHPKLISLLQEKMSQGSL